MSDEDFVPYLPPPEKILELYKKVDQGFVLELEWKNPGRRAPTPEKEEQAEQQEEEVEDTGKDFDFEEESREVTTPQRRTPGSALKGSARKQTTSLDSVLSNMARHRQIEEMEKS